jgi:hypothetical protein
MGIRRMSETESPARADISPCPCLEARRCSTGSGVSRVLVPHSNPRAACARPCVSRWRRGPAAGVSGPRFDAHSEPVLAIGPLERMSHASERPSAGVTSQPSCDFCYMRPSNHFPGLPFKTGSQSRAQFCSAILQAPCRSQCF